jgi:hypothetical protein
MLRIILITLTFIFFNFQLSAGKIEKAFHCLEQLDFFQAKKLFIHLPSSQDKKNQNQIQAYVSAASALSSVLSNSTSIIA